MSSAHALDVPVRPPEVPAWSRKGVWLQFVVGGLVGVALTTAVLRMGDGLKGAGALVLLASFIGMAWLQTVLHEAGHALAGLAVGMRPMAFGVGPLRAERGAVGWRVHWASSIRGVGGFALLLPRSGGQRPRETAIYLLGGPLANLLAAGVAWLAIASGWIDSPTWTAVAWTAVAVGLLLGLVNLVPFLAGGWSSDGRQLLKLWQGSDEARMMASLSRVGALSMLGVRPRDWPSELTLDLRLDDAPQAAGDALARCKLIHAIDTRRFDDALAADAAARLVGGFWQGPDGLRQINALLLAWWALEATGDAVRASAWCALSEGGIIDQSASRAALRACIALASGEADEARRQLALAEQFAPRVPDAASRAMLAETLDRVRQGLAEAAA